MSCRVWLEVQSPRRFALLEFCAKRGDWVAVKYLDERLVIELRLHHVAGLRNYNQPGVSFKRWSRVARMEQMREYGLDHVWCDYRPALPSPPMNIITKCS